MPNFAESLQGRDLGHLRIIAELWGIELEEQDTHAVVIHLTRSIRDPNRVQKQAQSLTSEEKEALNNLVRHAGRLPWAQFTRLYGELREMGVARRDREKPYQQPISAVESLWYKGFFARTFFDTSSGPEEFAYIPDDLLAMLSLDPGAEAPALGWKASRSDYAQVYLANDHILDHACTLLAALRLGILLEEPLSSPPGEELTPRILKSILATCGLLNEAGMPQPEPVRLFLEATRGESLRDLTRSWMKSTQFNELGMLPNLSLEGNWENDPLSARRMILSFLSGIPGGTWWSLDSFIAEIKKRDPDFQRPAGDYDSWFIRDTHSGEYLRGFVSWDKVDGLMIHFILTGPLHWLGILDLACPQGSQEASSFRLSGWADALLKGEVPVGIPVEKETLVVRSDARISARWLVPRSVRYQLSRFCEWGKETPGEYLYHITSASLGNARKQGLTINQLVVLLNRFSKVVPPSLIKALERWDKKGSEAKMEKLVILRVTSADILQALRKSRASRFLGDPLGPTIMTIKPGAAHKVLDVLAELGYLGEIRGDFED